MIEDSPTFPLATDLPDTSLAYALMRQATLENQTANQTANRTANQSTSSAPDDQGNTAITSEEANTAEAAAADGVAEEGQPVVEPSVLTAESMDTCVPSVDPLRDPLRVCRVLAGIERFCILNISY